MTAGDALDEHGGPILGVWGTFDLENFGDLLAPRIFVHEIQRRLPTAQVRLFSPLGWQHPLAIDGGFTAEPLGEPTPARLAQLAQELDLVAIGSGEIIHSRDELYARCYAAPADVLARLRPSAFFVEGLAAAERRTPVAWHAVGVPFDAEDQFATRLRSALQARAYVSVRDEISRARLTEIGVTRPVLLVPDPALVLDRTFGADVLERRRAFLRALGVYPDAAPLVVQGSDGLLPQVGVIGRAVAAQVDRDPALPVVLLQAGRCHGGNEFADAIAPYVPTALRLPDTLSVEDVVAAISGSRGFVGNSLHANIAALVFGLPSVIIDLSGSSKLEGFARLARCEARRASSPDTVGDAVAAAASGRKLGGDVQSLVPRVDEHFDALASIAEARAAARAEAERRPSPVAAALVALAARHTALARAFAVRKQQLERTRVQLALTEASLEQELTAARADLAHTRTQLEEVQAGRDAALAAVEEIHSTRLFRYAAPVRRAYGRARRR